MPDYTERVNRLRVLWNKGRNIYSSFYTELNEARLEVGDAGFASWCFDELRISLSVLNEHAKILKAADAAIVKEGLARAGKMQREANRAANAKAKQVREANAKIKADEAKAQQDKEAKEAKKIAQADARVRRRTAGGAPPRPKTDTTVSPSTKPVKDLWIANAITQVRDWLPHFRGTGTELKDLLLRDRLVSPPKSESVWGRMIQAGETHGVLEKTGDVSPIMQHGRAPPIYRVKTSSEQPVEQTPRQPENAKCVQLLAECRTIEATSRVELGKRYAEMKREVDEQRVGLNSDGKSWSWNQWSAVYIERSRSDIWKCIEEYEQSKVVHLSRANA